MKVVFVNNPRFSFFCIALFLTILYPEHLYSQKGKKSRVPDVLSQIEYKGGKFSLLLGKDKLEQSESQSWLSLQNMQGSPKGHRKGIALDFGNENLSGYLYYGFIPYTDSRHPQPVFFRSPAEISQGKALINLDIMRGRYDMIGWEKSGRGTVGYRIESANGQLLYDGVVSFEGTGPFRVAPTLTEGPFVNKVGPGGATISFSTLAPIAAAVIVNGQRFEDPEATLKHEIEVNGLEPGQEYEYTVEYGDFQQRYSFQTAPNAGSRQAFTFAYASDSRSGQGGGERNVYGANYYIMKRIMALSRSKDIAFFQFSGDLIDGYLSSVEATRLQYANWKRSIEPYAHYFPIYVSMGNHEALVRQFDTKNNPYGIQVDRFPYETESAEAVFAQEFVNPANGPESEDGSAYDPDLSKTDFPSYDENVFYYTYDNVAVIVLNSNYWYTPSTNLIPRVGGGLHGYIMDNQLSWLEATLNQLETDPSVDHVFVTQHTPCFPNGGHVSDDMWYRGKNDYRPFIAGKGVSKGIIERRDQYLDLLVNKSSKVIAILTGDEHNYARTEISKDMNIYPPNWVGSKLTLSRTIYQINNGAAGAPYYAQEQTPWTDHVSGFTTQNAVVFFHVDGKKIQMEVVNPDTLEPVDELDMRE